MQVKDIDINTVTPYPRNAKTHPEEQVAQIAKSIERFGWAQPLVIDNNNTIVIGHGRHEAAKLLGLDTVPCVVIDELTDEEIRMLRLADNKLNESPWDFNTLAEELEGLDFGDLDIFETDEDYLSQILDMDFEMPEKKKDTFQLSLTFDVADKNDVDSLIEQKGNDYVKGLILREARDI